MRLRATLATCALIALPAVAAPAAGADVFGPIELVSASAPAGGPNEQAGEAVFPVLSGDGRYVAFVGSYAGASGIWRRDLDTGAVEQVAPGDATMPSISANGRYVSFTTNEQLVPEDTNSSPDVYVRDMEPGEGEPEYALVSAVNGTDEGASYASSSSPGEEAEYGSLASARSAISASGNEVVFVTTAESNLLGGPEPTPAKEVLVRDLATEETTLVSAEYEPAAGRPANGEDRPVQPFLRAGAEPYGAVFLGGETPRFRRLQPNPSAPDDGQNVWFGASISADGNAVTWMGQELERQTRLLPGEQSVQEPSAAEPLWRDIGEGPAAPIRRVTGGSDPTNPLCVASGEQRLQGRLSPSDPCAGPFEHYLDEPGVGLWGVKVGQADYVPQLSANGMTVAFLTGARELASGELQFEGAESTDDLYIADMASGLARVQALKRLTAIGGGALDSEEHLEKSSEIVDYTVSPDGSQVAFTTKRTQYPLGSPAFVSAPAAAPGMIELFDIDLADDTLTRVTHGFLGEGERSEELPTTELPGRDPYHEEQGAYAPSFSADGNTLCFASTADNLVYGDGNDAPDAFIVHRLIAAPGVVAQYVSSPPPGPSIVAPWELDATAVSLANGTVRLYVEVPGAGTLSAEASSNVLVHSSARSSKHARGARTGRGSRLRRAATIATRTVASSKASSDGSEEGLVTLMLAPARAYGLLASRPGGLSGMVRISFSAPGHPLAHVSLPVRFVRTTPRAKLTGHAGASRSATRSASR
jgi:WD40 repeat protein